MIKQRKLNTISDLKRMKAFKRKVSVYQSSELINEIIINDIISFETEVDGQTMRNFIIIAEGTNDRFLMSNCHFYYG